MPAKCPLCGTTIVKPEGEVMHRCPNNDCPSRGLESLINWVMAAADIEGVGEQFVRRLWDLGLLRSIPDLYRLTKEQLAELDGYAEISAQNAVEAIAASKADPLLPRALRAQHPGRRLGDRAESRPPLRLGGRAARRAARRTSRRWTASGPTAPSRSPRGSPDERNRALVEELRGLGIRLELGEAEKPVEGPLTGQTYVITGTLERWSREQARAALEAKGAKVTDSVSKKTTAVVVGESPGSKVDKARKAGVEILDEAAFERLIG